jgi:hypothetical protein
VSTYVESDHNLKPTAIVGHSNHPPFWVNTLLPLIVFLAMECGIFLLDVVLPLGGLRFPDALLTQLGNWPLFPSHLIFRRAPITPTIPGQHVPSQLLAALGWKHIELLLGATSIVFVVYLLALRYLPQRISYRYIVLSTLSLGMSYMLMPVVTSSDLFSYIAYARIGVIYHLNPLTTLPTVIHNDPVYSHLYWTNQPSAYGPTWIVITCLLQWLTLFSGFRDLLSMVLVLRVFGLAMHLGSTWLTYSISGRMQGLAGAVSPRKRLTAVLAFAWNPLLLFEACVNAHNDTALLFCILLSIWFLTGSTRTIAKSYLPAIAMLAVATCLKVNVALLVPGLLFFLGMRSSSKKQVIKWFFVSTASYFGIIISLYAPFWQRGAVLDVYGVNPGTYRDANTLADFLSRLYNSIVYQHAAPLTPTSPVQDVAHDLSMLGFVLIYALLCWRAIHVPHGVDTLPRLLRWLALVWLLYCAIGSPWFWPWYTITFFGLYALIEAIQPQDLASFGDFRLPLAVRLLAFSMLSFYCFVTWIPDHAFVPGLPNFKWLYLSGLWVWLLPLLALRFPLKLRLPSKKELSVTSQLHETL